MRAISRTIILTVTFLIASGALLATTPVNSAEEKPLPQILFTNVNIFDGNSDSLAEGMSVLVEGNLIKQVKKGKMNPVANRSTPMLVSPHRGTSASDRIRSQAMTPLMTTLMSPAKTLCSMIKKERWRSERCMARSSSRWKASAKAVRRKSNTCPNTNESARSQRA